jgi:hypothetical protein
MLFYHAKAAKKYNSFASFAFSYFSLREIVVT